MSIRDFTESSMLGKSMYRLLWCDQIWKIDHMTMYSKECDESTPQHFLNHEKLLPFADFSTTSSQHLAPEDFHTRERWEARWVQGILVSSLSRSCNTNKYATAPSPPASLKSMSAPLRRSSSPMQIFLASPMFFVW